MIKSFQTKETKAIFDGLSVPKFRNVEVVALKRLMILDAAGSIADLKAIRGNHFEALYRDRKGQFSIRVNDQYRICFRWDGADAHDLELVDYH